MVNIDANTLPTGLIGEIGFNSVPAMIWYPFGEMVFTDEREAGTESGWI